MGRIAAWDGWIGAACALLLSVACDPGSPSAGSSARPSPAPPATASPRSVGDPALPGPGELSLQVDGARITLAAHRVPVRTLLGRLRDALRFEVEVAKDVRLPRAVSVQLADVGIDAVLEEILAGLPYAVFYAVDPDERTRVLTLVRVGESDADFAVAELTEEVPREPSSRDRLEEVVRSRTPQERDAAYEANQDRWWDDLYAEDPSARAYAVEAIYLDDQTFPIVAELLIIDPDPRVRAAAASTLGDNLGETAAADALLTALDDPNSEVVIEALDALEDVGNTSHISEIEPLLRHPDTEVQEAAIDAIEWLAE